jgi:hypothetical protein
MLKLTLPFLLACCISLASIAQAAPILKTWVSYLSEINEDDIFHKTSEKSFDTYVKKLSEVVKEAEATLNFISVGACDGGEDDIIDDFINKPHWRGVFIEAFSMNVADLKSKLTSSNNAISRSTIMNVAAADKCASKIVNFERPMYEEKNRLRGKDEKQIPHWLRRQIGKVTTSEQPSDREWTIEKVRCVSASDILMEAGNGNKMLTPHLVKIDVEVSTADVVASFINESVPDRKLPWLLYFEAKLMTEAVFAQLTARLQSRGYVVSGKFNDAAAVLTPRAFKKGKQQNLL